MAVSLSALIRRGFEDACRDRDATLALHAAWSAEPALRGLCLDELPRLMHWRSVPGRRQDEILAAAIRSYRAGCRRVWGPVLLAMLGPALVRASACLQAVPPAIAEEDVDQEVVLEALRASAQMPLPNNCRFVQRRLVFWAVKPVRRWLERETRRQLAQRDIDDTREVWS
jgi:hypothetical protein